MNEFEFIEMISEQYYNGRIAKNFYFHLYGEIRMSIVCTKTYSGSRNISKERLQCCEWALNKGYVSYIPPNFLFIKSMGKMEDLVVDIAHIYKLTKKGEKLLSILEL